MRNLLTWVFLFALIAIHTADMELTHYYIGNDAGCETFPPMSWCISKVGIDTALWISRLIMYPYFFLALLLRKKDWSFYLLVLITILYYTSMLDWTFQLGFWKWPFVSHLQNF